MYSIAPSSVSISPEGSPVTTAISHKRYGDSSHAAKAVTPLAEDDVSCGELSSLSTHSLGLPRRVLSSPPPLLPPASSTSARTLVPPSDTVAPSPSASTTSPVGESLTPQIELRLQLLPRIADASANGWISFEEETKFIDMLQSSNTDPKAARENAMTISRSLDTLALFHQQDKEEEMAYDDYDGDYDNDYDDYDDYDDHEPEVSSGGALTGIVRRASTGLRTGLLSRLSAASSFLTSSSRNNSASHLADLDDLDDHPDHTLPTDEDALLRHMDDFNQVHRRVMGGLAERGFVPDAPEDDSDGSFASVEEADAAAFGEEPPREVQNVQEGPSLTDLGGLVAGPGEVPPPLPEEAERMFLEMILFARAGFVQQPSCLRCAWEASTGATPQGERCYVPIVWRKDGNLLIQPEELEKNVAVVTCTAARNLLNGKGVVAGRKGCTSVWRWDAKRRQLKKSRS